MRTKLWVTIVGSVALAILLMLGLITYARSSCGQYPFFRPDCSELLSLAETQALLQSRRSAVEELMQVRPQLVTVSAVSQFGCPGKSVIVVSHPNERDCDLLNKILRKNFSDIPYRIVNN